MKFNKQILTEGLYVTGDGKGGRKVQFIPQDRMEHWANQHAEMRKAGLHVPAPEFHDPKATPTREEKGSKSNYGFWEELKVVETEDEYGNDTVALTGVLDVPLESDAEKIGKSVRDTSIYAVPEFVDGTGRIWKDVLTHVAVVTQPIEPGQKNFEQVGEGELALSMSHRLPIAMDANLISQIMDEGNANPDDLYEMLEKVAGIAVPRGTSPDRLTEALLAALRQKQLSEQNRDGGTVTKPPKDSQLNEVPVVMSNNNKTNEGAAQATAAAPPVEETKIVAEPSVEMSHLQQQNTGLMTYITEGRKSELKKRLDALKQRGIIVDDNVFNNLSTQIDSISEMAFDEKHQVIPSGVEQQIAALETVRIKMPENQPMVAMATQDPKGNYVIQPNPTPDGPGELTDERANEIVNNLMGTTTAS